MKNISMHDYVVRELEKRRGSLPDVALGARVQYRTVLNVLTRKTKTPGVDICQKLYDYFKSEEREALLKKLIDEKNSVPT